MKRKLPLFLSTFLLGSANTRAQTPFTYSTVDADSDHWDTSLAIGADGLGLISYYDSKPGDLVVAHCENVACSSSTITVVDTPGNVGSQSSIAIGADGLGIISYYDATNLALKIAHCSNTACTAATTVTLDTGYGASLTIGTDGLPLVAYLHSDGSSSGLKVAHCADNACTGATSAVLDGLSGGGPIAIAIGADGMGLIAYYQGATHDLKVAHCVDAACTAAIATTLDSDGFVGPAVSIAIGPDGLGLIAYAESDGNNAVKVAHCSDLPCSSATITRLESVTTSPATTSVAIGADGLGLVTYYARGIRVAHCANLACSNATFATLDHPSSGSNGSLALGPDGLPLISYIGVYEVKAARCGNARCQPPRGDFNADSRPDLVWRHDLSGQNAVWFMDGATLIGGATTNPDLADGHWKIVGTNDFNGDAKADLLWRHGVSGENAVWFMNGTALASGAFTNPAALPDVSWSVVATGDFLAELASGMDGRPDILWRHEVSGEIALWMMNGTTMINGAFTTPSALSDTNWRIAGAGDFNQDSKTDIVWHHGVSGQIALWYMNGPVMNGGTFTDPPALADTGWRIGAVSDYNLDYRPDIVWRHQGSGQVAVWYMNGVTLAGGSLTNPSAVADLNWKLVGPR